MQGLRPVIARAFNKNQILILNAICQNKAYCTTTLLNRLSETYGVPLSTLKLNARILKKLELIENDFSVELTATGRLLLSILGEQNGTG